MRSFFRSLRRWPAILVALALAASGAIAVATLPAAHASIPQNVAWKSSAPFGLWHNGGGNELPHKGNDSRGGGPNLTIQSFSPTGGSTQSSATDSAHG